MLVYAITIFLSAFLLFQVQLIGAKELLPWFGGSPALWTTCNMFFQGLLLGGYAYGHAANRLARQTQKYLHLLLLFASLCAVVALAVVWSTPITPGAGWRPNDSGSPILRIVTLLLVSTGLPFFLLSTTSPLLQAWAWRSHPHPSVYRLYALSNLGSLLGLLSYPFLVEPWLTLRMQGWLWSGGFAAFVLLCGYCAWRSEGSDGRPAGRADRAEPEQAAAASPGEKPGTVLRLLWPGLAACGSVLFLATTNQLCQEVAVVPLLWVLPLSIYLLTFILCFGRTNLSSRRWVHPAYGAGLLAACFVLYGGAEGHLLAQIAAYTFTLFAGCMVCHGELARSKPSPRFLTQFYLLIAVGGAAGAVFTALLAPLLFTSFAEYQVGLWATAALLVVVLLREKESWLRQGGEKAAFAFTAMVVLLPVTIVLAQPGGRSALGWVVLLVVLVSLALLFTLRRSRRSPAGGGGLRSAAISSAVKVAILGLVLYGSGAAHAVRVLHATRSFYGVLSVTAQDAQDPEWSAYALQHGRTLHGFQYLAPAKRRLPTTYYGATSGIGLALAHLPQRAAADHAARNLRIGVVGLGVGTLATYGQRGDYIRFYEIDPDVIRMATESAYFSYLRDCPAKGEVIPGDARLSLERELESGQEQKFDVLALDAFSGDAIPVHLLTREAFAIYLRHLRRPAGVLAVHVSNRYLDLRPVIEGAAQEFGLRSAWVPSEAVDRTARASDWVLLSRDRGFFNEPEIAWAIRPLLEGRAAAQLWTDEYSNPFRVLKKRR